MDRCTGRRYITEILLNTILVPSINRSINQCITVKINVPINVSINQPAKKPASQSVSKAIDLEVGHSIQSRDFSSKLFNDNKKTSYYKALYSNYTDRKMFKGYKYCTHSNNTVHTDCFYTSIHK